MKKTVLKPLVSIKGGVETIKKTAQTIQKLDPRMELEMEKALEYQKYFNETMKLYKKISKASMELSESYNALNTMLTKYCGEEKKAGNNTALQAMIKGFSDLSQSANIILTQNKFYLEDIDTQVDYLNNLRMKSAEEISHDNRINVNNYYFKESMDHKKEYPDLLKPVLFYPLSPGNNETLKIPDTPQSPD